MARGKVSENGHSSIPVTRESFPAASISPDAYTALIRLRREMDDRENKRVLNDRFIGDPLATAKSPFFVSSSGEQSAHDVTLV